MPNFVKCFGDVKKNTSHLKAGLLSKLFAIQVLLIVTRQYMSFLEEKLIEKPQNVYYWENG